MIKLCLLMAVASTLATADIPTRSIAPCTLDAMRIILNTACDDLVNMPHFKAKRSVNTNSIEDSVEKSLPYLNGFMAIRRKDYPDEGYVVVHPNHAMTLITYKGYERYKHFNSEKTFFRTKRQNHYSNISARMSYCCRHKCRAENCPVF